MRTLLLLWLPLAALLVSLTAFAADGEGKETFLTIGVDPSLDVLPVDLVNLNCPGVKLVNSDFTRPEVFPSTDPLPKSLSLLPDIMTAYVGFYDTDIPAMIEDDLIVPLNDVFEELNLDPKQVLPPAVYAAVSVDGTIVALPHRIESFVLSYRKDLFKKLGISPDLESWEAVLDAAETVSKKAVEGKQISGFLSGKIEDAHLFAVVLNMAMCLPPDHQPTIRDLVLRYQAKDIFMPPGFYWDDPDNDYTIRFHLFRTVFTNDKTGLKAFPGRLTAGSPDLIRPPGFLGCIALRRNTKRKIEAGKRLVKWLLTNEAQIALVNETELSKQQGLIAYHHIPVYNHVLQSPEFAEIVKKNPDYQVLLKTCERASFAPADKAALAQKAGFVQKRLDDAQRAMGQAGEEMAGYAALLEPVPASP